MPPQAISVLDEGPTGGPQETGLDVPLPPVQDICCRVTRLVTAAAGLRIVGLTPEGGRPLDFQAGQYARLSFGGLPARDYSIASRPGDTELEFHIRDAGGTGGSSYAVQHLQLGDRVALHGPLGRATLRTDHPGPVLGIAGGAGLAGIKSIAETALMRGHPAPVHLFFGVRRSIDLYLLDHFADLARRHPNFRFVPVLSEETHPGCRTGYVGEVAAMDFTSLSGFQAYLAGPPAMVEPTVRRLLAQGIDPMDIHTDAPYIGAPSLSRATAR